MPEATFLCLDTSEYTRNGDYGSMTRLMGIVDAANIITGAKLQSNPENTIGFLTMGGQNCVVHESLTTDIDRMLASLSRVKTEGSLHVIEGLRIGSLALAHRANTKGEKRLIAFVASPVTASQDTLVKLAKKLRKDEIAVDIINIGSEESIPVLTAFIEAVNKSGNSHFLHVAAPVSIPDCVVSSPILGGLGVPGSQFEFGVDPSMDPELAMVLRMSAEEERRRQEGTTGATGAPPVPPAPPIPTEVPAEAMDDDLALALQMSREEEMQRQEVEAKKATATTTPVPTAAPAVTNKDPSELTEEELMAQALKMSVEQEDTDPFFNDLVNDEQFLKDAAKQAGVDPSKLKKPDDKDKK